MDVVGLGACNVDFIQKVDKFAAPDDEVAIKELILSVGGSASNFTIGISRLGVKTGIMARVGHDYFGEVAEKEFKTEGVETQRFLMTDEKTGMVFIAVEPQGERSMYTFIGANQKFQLEKEDIDYIKESKLLHVTQMYQNVVERASKHANCLSFSPGPILSSFGLHKLEKILKRTDILFLNKKEMTILTGMQMDEGAQILIDIGVSRVIVTSGEKGATLYTRNEVIYSPAKKVKSIDTTGAGDAFAAGFIAAYIKEKELKECMEFANNVASYCVNKLGALNTPRLQDLGFK
ncbi:carbohydrate kinase family protein [Methanobacterium sp.]|uniref:carbohydrate kinase family protein n=1 Tax=Methanobacterium sp. TaxID=2164 RepID=UPI003D656B8F